MMHDEAIEHAKEQTRRAGDKDYVDVYWHSISGRWPTPQERAAMLKAGVIQAVPAGLRQEFPLRGQL